MPVAKAPGETDIPRSTLSRLQSPLRVGLAIMIFAVGNDLREAMKSTPRSTAGANSAEPDNTEALPKISITAEERKAFLVQIEAAIDSMMGKCTAGVIASMTTNLPTSRDVTAFDLLALSKEQSCLKDDMTIIATAARKDPTLIKDAVGILRGKLANLSWADPLGYANVLIPTEKSTTYDNTPRIRSVAVQFLGLSEIEKAKETPESPAEGKSEVLTDVR